MATGTVAMHGMCGTLALLVLCVTGCSQGPAAERQLLADAAGHAILPLYGRFHNSASALQAAADRLCAVPDAAAYGAARDAWRAAMADWQAAQAVQFGPVTIDNQAWKVQFWPDRNDLIRRKLEALLASGDELAPARLDADSVTIQGLSAAEYLLFDEQGGAAARYDPAQHDDAARRCHALQAIAGHTLGVAAFLRDAWDPQAQNYTATFTQPGPDNDDFSSRADAVGALLDSILVTLETVKDRKLAEPLGLRNRAGIAQPYASEAWRSRYSLPLIAASVRGLRTLYYAGDDGPSERRAGFDDLLRARGAPELAAAVDARFQDVDAALSRDLVLFDAVSAEEPAAALLRLHAALDALLEALTTRLPEVLGVTLGFNANDGD